MKNMISLVGTLTLICTVAGLLLSMTNYATKDLIAEAERNKFLQGLSAVVSDYDNSPDNDTVIIDDKTVYVFKKGDDRIGYAVEWVSSKGYSGDIKVLVGVDIHGDISGIEVLSHAETIGLGDKIIDADWRSTFVGRNDADKIYVKKDGGEIDEFSGATISPRAVAEAVRYALAFIQNNIIMGEL